MTILYKLTDENGRTYGGTQWGEGVTHRGTGQGELCGAGYIHAYEHPLIAVLLNPIHAGFDKPRLWEAEGEIALRDGQLKCGCVELTTLREIPVPEISTEQRVEFAIRCALAVYDEPSFVEWAHRWLDGTDRSAAAAEAARAARARAAEAARAWAAAKARAWAAEAARAWAAEAARAARAAETAAETARAMNKSVDLFAIAEQVVNHNRSNDTE